MLDLPTFTNGGVLVLVVLLIVAALVVAALVVTRPGVEWTADDLARFDGEARP